MSSRLTRAECERLFCHSFYVHYQVIYTRPSNFPAEYNFFFLCHQHERRQHTVTRVEVFQKFNNLCYTCPRCPRYVSEHFHLETQYCTPRCNPYRVVYSPPLPVETQTTEHRCQLHFYPTLSHTHCAHGTLIVPPHEFTPHFRDIEQWEWACRAIFRASRFMPPPHHRHMLRLPGY
jgi:hypothetical protein